MNYLRKDLSYDEHINVIIKLINLYLGSDIYKKRKFIFKAKMLKDLLKEVISLVAGKQSEDIVDILDEQKYINEFVIAKKLNLTINQVRNILYKISDYGLVSSIRKKDKKKGWYTYFWKIEILKALEFLGENMLKKTGYIEHQIKSRETKRFYACERCHLELNEENALLNNFTCNECGSLLVMKDNSKVIRDLKKSREKLERDRAIVEVEILNEREKEEKKRIKKIKKAEKIKKEELAKKKKQRQLLAKKLKTHEVKTKKKLQKKGTVKKKKKKIIKKKPKLLVKKKLKKIRKKIKKHSKKKRK